MNASNGATIPNFTKDLGDFEFDPGAKAVKQGTTTPSGLAVLYTTSNANIVALTAGGTKIVPVGKGTATITATQAGNAGYNAAPSKTFSVVVTEFSPYPDSFSGFIMWLDAKDVNGDGLSETAADFPSVSGKTQPTSWADLSLNSNTMAQSDTAKQPVYLVEGGLPVLAFGGTSRQLRAYMTGNMPAAFAGNSGFTMVVAMASAGSLPDRVLQLWFPVWNRWADHRLGPRWRFLLQQCSEYLQFKLERSGSDRCIPQKSRHHLWRQRIHAEWTKPDRKRWFGYAQPAFFRRGNSPGRRPKPNGSSRQQLECQGARGHGFRRCAQRLCREKSRGVLGLEMGLPIETRLGASFQDTASGVRW